MGKYTLPALPYPYDALEPHIDARTMEIHHTKHHQTYVDKLNAALEGQDTPEGESVEDLMRNFDKVPDSIKTPVRNHGGGHANHSLFWTIMAPGGGGDPGGDVAAALADAFGDRIAIANFCVPELYPGPDSGSVRVGGHDLHVWVLLFKIESDAC